MLLLPGGIILDVVYLWGVFVMQTEGCENIVMVYTKSGVIN